uniref:Uncharacterized protein n=1 Tax=Arundo donax TaxID=35708 RepID=A0A0A9HQM8_ARUDO
MMELDSFSDSNGKTDALFSYGILPDVVNLIPISGCRLFCSEILCFSVFYWIMLLDFKCRALEANLFLGDISRRKNSECIIFSPLGQLTLLDSKRKRYDGSVGLTPGSVLCWLLLVVGWSKSNFFIHCFLFMHVPLYQEKNRKKGID